MKKKEKKKKKYDIEKDYIINIKKIIDTIIKRPTIKYNSLLISEEKIRVNHFKLLYKIIKDFSNLFIIIYHGNCLRLYLSKDYEKQIKQCSINYATKNPSSKRLNQIGGIEGSSNDKDEKGNTLPNKYCYFEIDTKILNIKLIYKILRVLFEDKEKSIQYKSIQYKSIITITGRYGERGYSFTSDDYEQYSLHLTDQYFVSHSSFNCTDISQRLRLQGKYNDNEIKNKTMNLTLWTTKELQDVMSNFYVKFIKEIEKLIMKCKKWEDIKSLIEDIIDSGEYKFGKYMKYIDVRKKRKNIKIKKMYDAKYNGYKLFLIDDMSNIEIKELCKEKNLPEYICVNEIKEIKKEEFIEKYGAYKPIIPHKINKITLNIENKEDILKYCKNILPECINYSIYKPTTDNMNRKTGINLAIKTNKEYNFARCNINNMMIINYKDESYYHLVGLTENKKLPVITNDIKKTPYDINNDMVKYSIIKEKYKKENSLEEYILPQNYYWKSPDGWLILHTKDKKDIISLKILDQKKIEPTLSNILTTTITNVGTENVINNDIQLFVNSCFKKTENKRLRIGIIEIYNVYKLWSTQTKKKILKRIEFKNEIEKLNYKEEKSKGIDINNKSHKKGYNLLVSI